MKTPIHLLTAGVPLRLPRAGFDLSTGGSYFFCQRPIALTALDFPVSHSSQHSARFHLFSRISPPSRFLSSPLALRDLYKFSDIAHSGKITTKCAKASIHSNDRHASTSQTIAYAISHLRSFLKPIARTSRDLAQVAHPQHPKRATKCAEKTQSSFSVKSLCPHPSRIYYPPSRYE
jgi:hypothetical protein